MTLTMTMLSDTPAFNLKAVVRETGISPDTLRAWERRYGVPRPNRSSGRQRLYSQFDVDLLKWLVARQNDGLSISRAIEQWKQLHSVDDARVPSETASPPSSTDVVGAFGELSAVWVQACLDFDSDRADRFLSRAFGQLPPAQVCEHVIQRGIVDIGQRWYLGTATVHQEHFASELAVRQVERLMMAAAAPWRSGRIVVGCVAHESHALASLLFTLTLRLRGWDALFLGADVPVDWYGVTNALARPTLLVLSAQRITTAWRLLVAARVLVDLGASPAYAGRIFNTMPSLRERVTGYFLGESLIQAADAVETLHQQRPPLPDVAPLAATFDVAIDHFRERQLSIEASFERERRVTDVHVARVIGENLNLTSLIGAALAFGDLSLLEPDLEWCRGFLAGRGMGVRELASYLAAYERAARANLDERGRSILDWLRTAAETS